VQKRVHTSPDIVDDACAFAWTAFVRYQPERAQSWRGWMLTTAEREAWHLHAVAAGRTPFSDQTDGHRGGSTREAGAPETAQDQAALRLRLQEALQALATVSERRRQVKVLAVTGFSYDEIAGLLGLSYAQVNRLMTEANMRIRTAQTESSSSPLPTTAHAPPGSMRSSVSSRGGGEPRSASVWGAPRGRRAVRLAPGRDRDQRLPPSVWLQAR
jgi:RNA polymerase sigma factor (sigma-70 family)